jgi:UDP-GlcNAc:undecaprenyl-phosphate GlcNAc-1-phosphate transferase
MTIVFAFLVAFLVTLSITPWMKKLAVRTGFMDIPDARKAHAHPTPFLGGLAIFIGLTCSFLLFGDDSPHTLIIGFGALATLLLGLWDDKTQASAKHKLIGQVLIACATYFSGLSISFITNPISGGIFHIGWFSFPLTILWIVGIMNTLNLIDGIDGLASGVTAICAFMLTLVAIALGQHPVALLSASILGATIGFLRYNFSPAQIFLGDAGSLLLGYLLATVSIIGVLKSTLTLSMLLPLLMLAVPIFDTMDAILRRIRRGQPIYMADRDHIHHRLLRMGFNQKQVVLILYGLTVFFGAVALTLGWFNHIYAVIACTILFVFFRIVLIRFKQLPTILLKLFR